MTMKVPAPPKVDREKLHARHRLERLVREFRLELEVVDCCGDVSIEKGVHIALWGVNDILTVLESLRIRDERQSIFNPQPPAEFTPDPS